MSNQARFIVLEGIDGSGITTHSKLLHGWLEKTGQRAVLTKEPSDRPLGACIRRALGHQLSFDPRTLALLFAADRSDHLHSVIEPALAGGAHVVCDRYYLSSYAYQSLDQDLEWIMQMNRECRRPDVTLLLDVPVSVSLPRIKQRPPTWELIEKGQDGELFEEQDTLARVHANFLKIAECLRAQGETIIMVKGTNDGAPRPIAEVQNEIRNIVQRTVEV